MSDTIWIISGPFYDFVTSVEKIDPDQRLHVLLDPSMVMKQGA